MTPADRRKLNSDAGFSLLELLIAVVILAIIVIPLLNLFLSSNKLNIRSRQTLRATTAAQDIMEGLKAYNLEEIKAQFKDPASGFYVIDSRLIKGGVKEEDTLEVDPGLYVFSMKELNMQGSKFDAKIELDGRGYMSSVPVGTAMKDHDAHLVSPTSSETYKFNDAALADARSIDKKNGTFVETKKYRRAVLSGAFKNSEIKTAVRNALKASGVADADLDLKYAELYDESLPTSVHYKDITSFFDRVDREIVVDLEENASNLDKDGRPTVDMKVTQTYTFTYNGVPPVPVYGDIDAGFVGNNLDCGHITKIVDAAGKEKINVNLFYYPLYGPSGKVSDTIIVNNKSGAELNLLIAKQRYEKLDALGAIDLSDPEYYLDRELMQAEKRYFVDVKLNGAVGGGGNLPADKYTLKTNLGMNLVGMKYLQGEGKTSPYVNGQFHVNTIPMNESGSALNIFTLDGVRSPMGTAGAAGESTELIYDVRVSVYEEGAAAGGFPDDKRMIVIEGSTTN